MSSIDKLVVSNKVKGAIDMTIVTQFSEEGVLALPEESILFNDLNWHPHAVFEGVELKHLVTSEQTDGQFSYHLVRIAANKKIGMHIHDEQLETHEVIAGSGICINDQVKLTYNPGVISILKKKIQHEVIAGEDGLVLFAKFMPALL